MMESELMAELTSRPVGRGGFERTPLFDLQMIFYTPLNCILPFESSPLVSLLLRITAVQTSLVAATDVQYAGSFTSRVSCVRRCDEERARINARK